jgi:hypothetical protein
LSQGWTLAILLFNDQLQGTDLLNKEVAERKLFKRQRPEYLSPVQLRQHLISKMKQNLGGERSSSSPTRARSLSSSSGSKHSSSSNTCTESAAMTICKEWICSPRKTRRDCSLSDSDRKTSSLSSWESTSYPMSNINCGERSSSTT